MAAVFAILSAVRRSVQRDLGTFQALKVNNFFLFIFLLIAGALSSGVEPVSAEPLLLLLGLLALFPISSDPLARIPPSRLSLWPLSRRQRFALRIASLALSPIAWMFTCLLSLKSKPVFALAFLVAAALAQAIVILSGRAVALNPHWNLLRYVPAPPGSWGGLVRNNLRQILTILDFYVAAMLSLGSAAYRWSYHAPDPAAFPILAVLIALALSTYAQSLFGLELGAAITRYRLLPLRGWQILAGKDVAFLLVLFILVLPLDPLSGMAAGLTAVAIGHHSSVYLRLPQQRWRFTGGRLLPVGALQAFACVAVGIAEAERGPFVLALALLAFLASLAGYGRCWDRRSAES